MIRKMLPGINFSRILVLFAVYFYAAGALAYIHPSAPSASHELEEAAHAIHDYLHDNYATSYGAHDFENAAHTLHGTLHDWSNGAATESSVVTDYRAVTAAWQDFSSQLRMSGLISSDTQLKALFKGARKAWKRVRFLLRKASDPSFIHPSAPSAAHELEEHAHELHAWIHDNYSESFGSHAFENAAHDLHDALHHWSQGQATESEVVVRYDAVKGAWKDLRYQLRRARLLNGSDPQLRDIYEQTRAAYKRVRKLLRKAD